MADLARQGKLKITKIENFIPVEMQPGLKYFEDSDLEKLKDAFKLVDLTERKSLDFDCKIESKEKNVESNKVLLKEIDDRLLTIEDFLNSD